MDDKEHAPLISLEQAQTMADGLQFPKVTADRIKDKIASVNYIQHDTLTIAVITMRNGFKVLGKAAPADSRNYDANIGERYAYEDAFRQIWPLEGYLLCERLTA